MDEHLNVIIEPRSSFRGWNLGIRTHAILVKPRSGCVAGTVTLSSRFNPYQCINKILTSLRRRSNTIPSVIDITPVPTTGTNILLTTTALVNDKMNRETTSFEERLKSLGVTKFGPVWVIWTGTVNGVGSSRVVAIVV